MSDYAFLFFDVETTGLPLASQLPTHPKQPHVTQLGAILEKGGIDVLTIDALILPENWPVQDCGNLIGARATELTGITDQMCFEKGIPIADAIEWYMIAQANADFLVCHNTAFDSKLIGYEFARLNNTMPPAAVHGGKDFLCTMKATTPILKLPKKDGRAGNKWPKLSEAYLYYFKKALENAHSAIVDISATREIFNVLVNQGVFDAQFEAYEKRKALLAAG